MRYVSVDIETTGLDPDICDVIEIGAVVDDLMDQKPLDKLPRYHAYVVPRWDKQVDGKQININRKQSVYIGEPYALGMHAEIFRRIAKREEPYKYTNGLHGLRDFLYGHFPYESYGTGGIRFTKKIPVAGKNFNGFDRNFLKKFSDFEDLNFGHRVIDPAMYWWNPAEDEVLPDSAECMKRAGMYGEVAHTAVEDALMVVRLVRAGVARTGIIMGEKR